METCTRETITVHRREHAVDCILPLLAAEYRAMTVRAPASSLAGVPGLHWGRWLLEQMSVDLTFTAEGSPG
jgi:hypothetical protein